MTTKYWANGTAGFASTGTWSPVGAPANGDDVVIDSHSYQDLGWDLGAVTLNSFACTGNASATRSQAITLSAALNVTNALSILSLHATNTITVNTSTFAINCGALTLDTRGCLSQTGTAGNVTCTSFTQSGVGSVLTGKVNASITCSGNFTYMNSGLTSDTVNLILTGPNTTLHSTNNSYIPFHGLTVLNGANVLIDTFFQVTTTFHIFGTLTTGTNEVSIMNAAIDGTIVTGIINSGANSSTSGIEFVQITDMSDRTLGVTTGIFNGQINFRHHVNSGASRAIKLSNDFHGTGLIYIFSERAVETMTLDLNGYNLSCNGLIVGTRGILLGRTGIINNSGNLDTSAGTFTAGTSTYITSSASSTLILAAGGTLYNFIAKSSVITLLANATISKLFAHSNPVIKGAYTLTLTDPTKEYTGMRRPIRLPLKKLDIGQVCAQCGWMRNLGALL